jgi:hypothetical protein
LCWIDPIISLIWVIESTIIIPILIRVIIVSRPSPIVTITNVQVIGLVHVVGIVIVIVVVIVVTVTVTVPVPVVDAGIKIVPIIAVTPISQIVSTIIQIVTIISCSINWSNVPAVLVCLVLVCVVDAVIPVIIHTPV